MPNNAKTIAFVEFAPVVEEFVAEQLGRITLAGKAGKLARLLPLPEALRKIFRQTERETQTQTAEDAKHVIKVSDAVTIVREELTKIQEAAEVISIVLPAPGKEPTTVSDRIIRRFREDQLRQDKPRLLRDKHVYTRKP